MLSGIDVIPYLVLSEACICFRGTTMATGLGVSERGKGHVVDILIALEQEWECRRALQRPAASWLLSNRLCLA